jgi:hypothetical protein
VEYSASVSLEHIPVSFGLRGCFPNPATNELRASFVIPQEPADLLSPQATILAVYDIQGRLARTVLNKVLPPGTYTATWDGCDDNGRGVSSGVYLCVLRHGHKTDARRLVVLR